MNLTDSTGYILGPMTGYKDNNRKAFNDMAERLRSEGIDVINPSELDEIDPATPQPTIRVPGPGGHSKGHIAWEDYIRRDLPHLSKARWGIALPGWEESRGARLEAHILSHVFGCPVFEAVPETGKFHPVDPDRIPTLVGTYGV
jgi:hypothetical protein